MISLDTIQAVIFDMDGVLWRGDEPLPGIPAIFSFLQANGIAYAFATNNSAKTPAMYVEKMQKLSIPATTRQIITSAIATAHFVRKTYPTFKTAYIVGGAGLIEAFEGQGFEITDAQADVVVVGFDRTLTYEKLRTAAYQIQGGAHFVGSNPDKSFPEPHGFAPGAGSIIAAIEAATGVRAAIVGKPFPPMFHTALAVLGTSPSSTLMVGDRLETDIEGATGLGLRTALVLSGVSSRDDIIHLNITPDSVFDHLAHLQQVWQAALA